MRTDIHAPSSIIPSDYQYVAVWTMNIQGLGDAQFILREREIIREHMARTKGEYAHVETSGSCQVCGNVQAIYLALFYHEKSNTYLRVGFDCEAKLGMSGDERAFNLFRRQVQDAREAQAGKRKAIAILGDNGHSAAWDIYSEEYPRHLDGCPVKGRNQFGDDNGVDYPCALCEGICRNRNHGTPGCTCEFDQRIRNYDRYEERTIRDIVGKLVKYGSISPKSMDYIGTLLGKITNRPIIDAQRKAEAEAAGPVPTGRVLVTGIVLALKEVERQAFYYGDDGLTTKVLIKLENGSKVWGTRFANIDKGQTVTFKATIEASKDDLKFGFFKRPALPKRELSKVEKKAKTKLNRILRTIPVATAAAEFGYWNAFYDTRDTLYKLIAEIETGEKPVSVTSNGVDTTITF